MFFGKTKILKMENLEKGGGNTFVDNKIFAKKI